MDQSSRNDSSITEELQKHTELLEKIYETQHKYNGHVMRRNYITTGLTVIKIAIAIVVIAGAYNFFDNVSWDSVTKTIDKAIRETISSQLPNTNSLQKIREQLSKDPALQKQIEAALQKQ